MRYLGAPQSSPQRVRAAAAVVLRLALASPFLLSGLAKALDFAGAVGEVRALTGLEPAAVLAALVIAVQLGGSALLLAGGGAARLGALALAGFTIVASVLAHDFWNRSGAERLHDATTFLEHAGLVAGLLLAARARP